MVNVYDFDNTIYDWESSAEFFKFCVKKYPFLLKYAPKVARTAILYKLNVLKLEQLTDTAKIVGDLMKKWGLINNDIMIQEFWNKNKDKIKSFMSEKLTTDDIVISASPRFLLEEIIGELKISTNNLICSEFSDEGVLEFACYGKNKIKAYENMYGQQIIDNFYTDSMADLPMIAISKNAFLVKWNKIEKLK